MAFFSVRSRSRRCGEKISTAKSAQYAETVPIAAPAQQRVGRAIHRTHRAPPCRRRQVVAGAAALNDPSLFLCTCSPSKRTRVASSCRGANRQVASSRSFVDQLVAIDVRAGLLSSQARKSACVNRASERNAVWGVMVCDYTSMRRRRKAAPASSGLSRGAGRPRGWARAAAARSRDDAPVASDAPRTRYELREFPEYAVRRIRTRFHPTERSLAAAFRNCIDMSCRAKKTVRYECVQPTSLPLAPTRTPKAFRTVSKRSLRLDGPYF